MAPKLDLSDKQLDMIDKALRNVWFMAIGGVLLLAAFVYLLATLSPPALGS